MGAFIICVYPMVTLLEKKSRDLKLGDWEKEEEEVKTKDRHQEKNMKMVRKYCLGSCGIL